MFDMNMNRIGYLGMMCQRFIQLVIGREERDFTHIMETAIEVMRYVHFSDRYSPQEFFEGKRVPSKEEQHLYGQVFMSMVHQS